MERGSSVAKCRTCNRVSPGSNPPLLPFRRLGIFVLSIVVPVESALSGPTYWILRYIKTTFNYLALTKQGWVGPIIVFDLLGLDLAIDNDTLQS